MTKVIKNQFRLQQKDWTAGYLITIGAGIFGILLLSIILKFSNDTSYAPMGGILSGIVAFFYSGLMVLLQMSNSFNFAVSMGRTRKSFFVSYYIVALAGIIVAAALVFLFFWVENMLYPNIYPGYTQEVETKDLNRFLPYVLPGAVLYTSALVFCGASLMKFGRKAFWVLWCLWMLGCLGLPRMIDAADENPASLYGIAGRALARFVQGVPFEIWIAAFILACIFFPIFAYRMIRRQQVTG